MDLSHFRIFLPHSARSSPSVSGPEGSTVRQRIELKVDARRNRRGRIENSPWLPQIAFIFTRAARRISPSYFHAGRAPYVRITFAYVKFRTYLLCRD